MRPGAVEAAASAACAARARDTARDVRHCSLGRQATRTLAALPVHVMAKLFLNVYTRIDTLGCLEYLSTSCHSAETETINLLPMRGAVLSLLLRPASRR